MSEIYSRVNSRDTKQRHWLHSGIFIVNFEQISHIILQFLLLTLNKHMLTDYWVW